MYHIFIHSSTDGHLDSFHFLAIMNSHVGVHVSFWIVVFSEYIWLEVGLLDHMVVLFLIFWGSSMLFSIVAAPTYIPSNSVEGFPFFPHPLQDLLFLDFKSWPFYNEVIPHYSCVSLVICDVNQFVFLQAEWVILREGFLSLSTCPSGAVCATPKLLCHLWFGFESLRLWRPIV